jgi:phosphoadenosine phosphosulfate reductase
MSVEVLNKERSKEGALERLKWAFTYFNNDEILFTSAIGSYSAAYLHLASIANPNLCVNFIDTGFHFKETWDFAKELETRLNIKVIAYKHKEKAEKFYSDYTKKPYEIDSSACCHFHKVEALNKLLYGKKLWITGIQAYQSSNRQSQEFLQLRESGVYKLNPILDWSKDDICAYLAKHDLPYHPLYEKGYLSIGCEPCTGIAENPDDERSGRWKNSNKTECGLHLP